MGSELRPGIFTPAVFATADNAVTASRFNVLCNMSTELIRLRLEELEKDQMQ